MKKLIAAFLAFVFAFVTSVAAFASPPPIPPTPLTLRGISTAGGASNLQIYNLKDSNIRKYRKAVANTQLGISDTVVAFFGDSRFRGVGAGGTSALTQYRNGMPKRVGEMLNGWHNLKVSNDSFVGSGTADATKVGVTLTYDPWVSTSGSGVTVDSSIATLGLGGFMVKLSAAGTFSFAPPDTIDRCDVMYYQSASTATVNVNVDGGSTLATLSRNGTAAIVKTTVSFSSGVHTVNVVWASGTFYLYGLRCYLSTVKEIAIVNYGTGSMAASNGWSQSPANQWEIPIAIANTSAGLAPNLTIVGLATNDVSQGQSLTTFESNMRYIIARAQLNGDVVIWIPSQGPSAALTNMAAYQQVLEKIALSMDLPYIKTENRIGSASVANADGLINSDGVHETLLGYGMEAPVAVKLLQDAM